MINNERKEECKYMKEAECYPSERNCSKCGWNPEVAQRRLENIMAQHNTVKCVHCGAVIPAGRYKG